MAKKRAKKRNPRRRRKNPSTGRGSSSGATAVSRSKRRHRKGHSRKRARRYVASRGRGQHRRARTYQVRNKHGRKLYHVRGWRAHRKSNGASGLLVGAIALAAGVVVSVGVSFLVDQTLSSQSSAVQDGVLVGAAALAAWFVPNPALVGGIVTGLLLVPAAKLVYTAVPSLASTNVSTNPEAILGTPSASTTQQGLMRRRMGALHPAGAFGMGALHPAGAFRGMGALHPAGGVNDLFSQAMSAP